MRFTEEGCRNQRKDGDGFLNCLGVCPRCIRNTEQILPNLSREVGNEEAVWASDSGHGWLVLNTCSN